MRSSSDRPAAPYRLRCGTQYPPDIALAAAEDWTGAEELHRRAVEEADSISHGFWQADTRDWYAQTLLDRGAPGDIDPGRALLADAAARYASMGAHFLGERTQERLAAL